MRFHIGFSKRISLKWLLLIIGGLLAFFGIDKVHAETLAAVPNNVYVKSPQVDQEYAYAGDLINAETGTPYTASWDGETYYAFQTITSPYTSLGKGQDIRGARLRWTFPTAQMNKCSSNQSITYTFEFYLRKLYSSGISWNKGFNAKSSQDVWIRSSSQNYDCTVSSLTEKTMKATCTMPNPSSNVYFYLDNFSIPVAGWYQTSGSNAYYNVGVRSVTYTCTGVDSGAIINNQNQNTTTIINNNNQNTQQIIDSQQDINDSINNDDVQSGTSHGGNFFNNTQINDHGISIIATAPIRLLQGMLNSGSSCNDLILTSEIFGQDKLITMPSGCILWNRAPSTVVSIYHITVFGLFGYFVLVDIWHTINAVIDPERKNDYVMDL